MSTVFLSTPSFWDTALEQVLGRSGKKITQKLGLHTVGDLLSYYPRRYHEKGRLTAFSELNEGEEQSVVARIADAKVRSTANRRWMLTLTLTDGEGVMDAIFWAKSQGVVNWMARQLPIGATMLFSGKPGYYRDRMQLTHPSYEEVHDDNLAAGQNVAAQLQADQPVPIYPAVSGMPTWSIAKAVQTLLAQLKDEDVPQPIPAEVLAEEDLLDPVVALRAIHEPQTRKQYEQARNYFKFEEAFVLQVALAQSRIQGETNGSYRLSARIDGVYERVKSELPFTLTDSQQMALVEIDSFVTAGPGRTLNHLLQGDVGAGKTVVALLAMLRAVDAGYQAVLLAPTEVLVEQHFESIRKMLGRCVEPQMGNGPECPLYKLTSALKISAKREVLSALASGAPGIVVGTHALLSENVQLPNLGLVVVDEQHRFGVEQRDHLRQANADGVHPHLLVMTATPIPRTVAMTSFGDLETIILKSLPQGRKPVHTAVVSSLVEESMRRVFKQMKQQVEGGGRVFVVCPAIDPNEPDMPDKSKGGQIKEERLAMLPMGPSENPRVKCAVTQVADDLAKNPQLNGIKVGLLHGRMSSVEKETAMQAFRQGQAPILVATTVIEVGVDVPEATMMVILDADYFGLSQLHQLRGRIGRGNLPGLCICATPVHPQSLAGQRLMAFATTTDGFQLAQIDLQLRQSGDILGANQSGRSRSLKILDLMADQMVIEEARKQATVLVSADVNLSEYPQLAQAIAKRLTESEAEFLNRG